MITVEKILIELQSHGVSEKKLKEVQKAYILAADIHNGQYRQSGEPYIIHPLNVAKNLLDMKQACKDYFDPRSPDYDNTVMYVRLLLRLLDQSSIQYRDRYELSTHRIDDMRSAIHYLLALRRLQILINMKDEAEDVKKKAQVWKEKMEADHKKGIAS